MTLMKLSAVVPYVGTWIEIWIGLYGEISASGRSLRGNVDRNTASADIAAEDGRRSLRGNVDRNS